MCKAPKAPKPPDPITPADLPQPPNAVNPAALRARAEYAKQAALAKGFSSTILTGGRGLSDSSATTAQATLLGSGGPDSLNSYQDQGQAKKAQPVSRAPVQPSRKPPSFVGGLDQIRKKLSGGSTFLGSAV